jgi:hypothetical protein
MAKQEYYTCDLTGEELLDLSEIKTIRTVTIKDVGTDTLETSTKYHIKNSEIPEFFTGEIFTDEDKNEVPRTPYFIHGTIKDGAYVKSSYQVVAWGYNRPSGLGKDGGKKLVVKPIRGLSEECIDFIRTLEKRLLDKNGS